MLQTIQIIGNLTADAELKVSQNGNEFVAFRVAVNENLGDEKRTTFYDVSYPKNKLFGYLKKGISIYVSGRLSISAVLGKDGKPYMNAYINARDVALCGAPQKEN